MSHFSESPHRHLSYETKKGKKLKRQTDKKTKYLLLLANFNIKKRYKKISELVMKKVGIVTIEGEKIKQLLVLLKREKAQTTCLASFGPISMVSAFL